MSTKKLSQLRALARATQLEALHACEFERASKLFRRANKLASRAFRLEASATKSPKERSL